VDGDSVTALWRVTGASRNRFDFHALKDEVIRLYVKASSSDPVEEVHPCCAQPAKTAGHLSAAVHYRLHDLESDEWLLAQQCPTTDNVAKRGNQDAARSNDRHSRAMNAINLIVPYRHQGMWLFDDTRVGRDKEPFVSGADKMIDMLVREIPNAQQGFRLPFSATPEPRLQAMQRLI
jgi:hypothetical protein